MPAAIAIPLALGIGGAAAGVGGAAISANASGKAASEQQQGEQQALDFQKQVYGQTQQDEQPYLDLGKVGASDLTAALPSLTQGFDPTAAGVPSQFNFDPTNLENTAGYQFARDQGDQGIERAATAAGGINGGTLKALDQYNVGLANQNESSIYNQQLAAYNTNYGNAFNTFESNQSNTYNRLMALIGTGSTAAGTLANAGSNFANAAGNTAVGSANAGAAGTVGAANAFSGGLTNSTNSITNGLLLQQLLGGAAPTSTSLTNASLTGGTNPVQQSGLLNPATLNLQNTPGVLSASGYGGAP